MSPLILECHGNMVTQENLTHQQNGSGKAQNEREMDYKNPNEAEQGGVEYAKKWIDDRKPDL
jgi:hypothetical protein